MYRTDNLPVTPVPVNIPVSAHEHARARKERPLGDLGVMEAMHDAGEMTLVFGGGERGLTFDVASRGCPPDCDFGINWRPSLTLTGTGL